MAIHILPGALLSAITTSLPVDHGIKQSSSGTLQQALV